MGNKKKEDKWSPATELRIMAFARSLVPNSVQVQLGKEPKPSEIQDVLAGFVEPIYVDAPTVKSWLIGEKHPSARNIDLIKKGSSCSSDWLEPAFDSSPMRRFLCALDVWGAPLDSSVRKLDATSMVITVENGLSILAKRWASTPIVDGNGGFCGFAIPMLKCRVPHQISLDIYQSSNPLTLMDFMFRCGCYLEFSEEELLEWAIDLASLTLIVGAFLEGTSLARRFQSGKSGCYNWLMHRIFFRAHGDWPSSKLIRDQLEGFPEFDGALIDYPMRLMQARDLLEGQLLSIGSNLSIAEVLSYRIKNRNSLWQEPMGAGEVFEHKAV